MDDKRTSTFSNMLIWFGAGVCLDEMLTGIYFAPLGFGKGILANLLGHLIGCAFLFAAGLIGAKTRRSSMETVKMSFGTKGSFLFSVLNVIQLVGWTAVMVYYGAAAAAGFGKIPAWVWSLAIGLLIVVWVLIGITNLGKINTVAMGALFILTLVLCKVIFIDDVSGAVMQMESISFGSAVELAVAMPLSWLPLISDYTRSAKKPLAATAASAITYGCVSCWMYLIGMGAALIAGESDIASIIFKAGLGIFGLLIIVISTVTTTFLDAYSAGVSCESVFKKCNGKRAAAIVSVIGTIGAIVFLLNDVTDFLTTFLSFISSVFAPMVAILVTDYFILKNDCSNKMVNIGNLIIWLIGFVLYQIFMNIDTVIGNSLPVMLIVMILTIVVHYLTKGKGTDKGEEA